MTPAGPDPADAFVDRALARRFEAFDAEYAAHMVALRAAQLPGSGAETLVRAGATCAWFAHESVLSHVFGLGLEAETTDADLEAIEAFYRAKGDGRVQVELCPFANKASLDRLGARGYRITGFEQVMAQRLGAAAPEPLAADPRIVVRAMDPASETERSAWIRVAGEAFFAPDLVPQSLAGVFEVIGHLPGTVMLAAFVDDRLAAVAGLTISGGLASLFAGATLPEARRGGAHRALLAARLGRARAAGAEWAVAGALPGSGSQHNMERHGFRVAYTRAVLGKTL